MFLEKIFIKNFRSLWEISLHFEKNNIIIGKNGTGKTNILWAIWMLFWNNILKVALPNLLKDGSDVLYLEGSFIKDDLPQKVTFSYDGGGSATSFYTLNGKKVSKNTLFQHLPKVSYFSPIDMNLLYLGPKYRRNFLDTILSQSHRPYASLLTQYEKIVKSRNKVLKNISLWFSEKQEITFWDEKFIQIADEIYTFRIGLNTFIQKMLPLQNDIFINKEVQISYQYISKVDLENIKPSIKTYLEKNLSRDIILWKTPIGPHIDDFDILINGKSIIDFASRGEIKSLLIALKKIEVEYITSQTASVPLILIDDLSSELDDEHKNQLLQKLEDFQQISTSITPFLDDNYNTISI